MKLLALVIVYNPDLHLLKMNIHKFAKYVDKVLVWRNSSFDYSCLDIYGDKIEFCGDCDNVGLPKALNYAWHYGRDNGYTHLLTMDQDSQWKNFGLYIEKISLPEAPKKAFWGPSVMLYLNYGHFRRKEARRPYKGPDFVKADDMITSGMIIPMEVLDATHGWSEEFKVDGVDMDFCYHARSLGFTPYTIKRAILVQHFGSPVRKYYIFGIIRMTTTNYSAERLYYICKNITIVVRRYPKLTRRLNRVFTSAFMHRQVKYIILSECDKKRKLRAIFSGVRDGRAAEI